MSEFQEGDRVKTFDGFPGRVRATFVENGTQKITVRHWVGGGAYYSESVYEPNELTKLTDQTDE